MANRTYVLKKNITKPSYNIVKVVRPYFGTTDVTTLALGASKRYTFTETREVLRMQPFYKEYAGRFDEIRAMIDEKGENETADILGHSWMAVHHFAITPAPRGLGMESPPFSTAYRRIPVCQPKPEINIMSNDNPNLEMLAELIVGVWMKLSQKLPPRR